MEFKGKVFKHPDYVQLEKEIPELSDITKAFKCYWQSGYHPIVGKDGILPVPEIYSANAIGRAHIEQTPKDEKSYSSSQKAWDDWGDLTINVECITPTSNTFIIYCVNDSRDCCILGYIDNNNNDSHDILKKESFRKLIRNRAEKFYKTTKTFALQKAEHEDIFSENWIKE